MSQGSPLKSKGLEKASNVGVSLVACDHKLHFVSFRFDNNFSKQRSKTFGSADNLADFLKLFFAAVITLCERCTNLKSCWNGGKSRQIFGAACAAACFEEKRQSAWTWFWHVLTVVALCQFSLNLVWQNKSLCWKGGLTKTFSKKRGEEWVKNHLRFDCW